MEAIFKRRSIRKYKPESVQPEKMSRVLSAAAYAPSAGNKQPWVFIVCDDRALLNRIHELHPYSNMLTEAPAAIIVCADLDAYSPGANTDFFLLDCAAAIQNLMLEAYELGLGTCWLGVSPNKDRAEEIGALFGLPERVVVHSVVAIGYPDEEKDAPPRKDTPIRYNKF